MARRALEIVRHCPVVFIAKGVLNHGREGGRDAPELLMAEGIHRARVREEAAVGVVGPFRDRNHAVAHPIDGLFNLRQESLFVKGPLREDDDVGRVIGRLLGEPRGSSDPPRMAPHHFENEHLGGGLGHGRDVQSSFPGGHGHVLRHGTKARAAVRKGQIVIDGLGHSDAGHGEAHGRGQLGHLVRRVLGVAAAVVKEVANVVGGEHLDKPLVLGAVLLQGLQLVAAGAKGAARGVLQGRNGGRAFPARIDELFPQRP